MGNVIGGADGEDPFISACQKSPLQKAGALVMEEEFIPAVFDQLRDHHDYAAAAMLLRKIQNVLNDGDNDETVRRRQNGELGRFGTCSAVRLLDVTNPILVQEF